MYSGADIGETTPGGPIILEGNDDWEIGGPQDTGGGLRQRWMELTGVKI